MTESAADYRLALENMRAEDKRTQDYLHQLELNKTTYNQRAKIATQLATCRKDRRYYKDIVDELEPINRFMEKYKAPVEALRRTLGSVREAEKYHKNRMYRPKVERVEEHK